MEMQLKAALAATAFTVLAYFLQGITFPLGSVHVPACCAPCPFSHSVARCKYSVLPVAVVVRSPEADPLAPRCEEPVLWIEPLAPEARKPL